MRTYTRDDTIRLLPAPPARGEARLGSLLLQEVAPVDIIPAESPSVVSTKEQRTRSFDMVRSCCSCDLWSVLPVGLTSLPVA